jgi:putative membrane protein
MRRVDASALRLDPSVLWPAALVGAVMLGLAAIDPLLHEAGALTPPDPWAVWPVTPGITLSILLAAWLYIAGEREPGAAERDRFAGLRHLAFFCGLAALFLALQSPIEPVSDHQFLVHQIEHMLLRTTAPMLLVLAAPQAGLLRGMPGWLRRRVVAPVLGNPAVRALGILGHPAIATVLFVGTTYFWMIPRFHDIAILDEDVHYLWHTTLLLSGLIFFWRLLDPRPSPRGASLGVRLFMFWIAAIGNILLGSYLSLKHEVLYQAYGEMGRLWAISPAVDENYGGLVMWIPGSMMFVLTAMLMIYRWAQQEERSLLRSHPGAGPVVTAAEFVGQRRSANRRMAIGLVCFMATVIVITFTTMLTYHFAARPPGLGAF